MLKFSGECLISKTFFDDEWDKGRKEGDYNPIETSFTNRAYSKREVHRASTSHTDL